MKTTAFLTEPINTDPLCDTATAAGILHLSPRTLEALRCRGGSPRYIKLGKKVLYRLSDLEAFIAAGERTSTSDPGPGGDSHGT